MAKATQLDRLSDNMIVIRYHVILFRRSPNFKRGYMYFDKESMEEALKSPRKELPEGLTREEKRLLLSGILFKSEDFKVTVSDRS